MLTKPLSAHRFLWRRCVLERDEIPPFARLRVRDARDSAGSARDTAGGRGRNGGRWAGLDGHAGCVGNGRAGQACHACRPGGRSARQGVLEGDRGTPVRRLFLAGGGSEKAGPLAPRPERADAGAVPRADRSGGGVVSRRRSAPAFQDCCSGGVTPAITVINLVGVPWPGNGLVHKAASARRCEMGSPCSGTIWPPRVGHRSGMIGVPRGRSAGPARVMTVPRCGCIAGSG